MKRSSPALALFGLVALCALVGWTWMRVDAQQGRIETLSRQVQALSAAVDAAGEGGAVQGGAQARRAEPGPQGGHADPGSPLRIHGRSGPGAEPALAVPRPFAPAADRDAMRGGLEVIGQPPAKLTRDALVEVLDSDDPAVRGRLREVVKEQQELERDARREQRQQRWEQDTLSRLEHLSAEVGLDDGQQDSLFAILSRARDLTGEAFRAAREDHSFGDARDKAQKYRSEADTEARALMSETQFSAYEKMRNEERERRGIGSR